MFTLPSSARSCGRCEGLVVDEPIDDELRMLRCLNCGWMGDKVTRIWSIVMDELEEEGS